MNLNLARLGQLLAKREEVSARAVQLDDGGLLDQRSVAPS